MKQIVAIVLFLSGINLMFAQSEDQAEQIAAKVIEANGGAENFKNTNYIGWNFFESRQIIWDQEHNRVRIDYLKKRITIITELDSDTGKLFINGVESTNPDSLKKYMARGKVIWMNDSYWLAMPFKILDDGVHLTYIGKGRTIDSSEAIILQMTFENVGATPENKYLLYIDPESYLVLQWDFYNSFHDAEPEFRNVWTDYKQFGSILLSGDRGTEGTLTNIHTWDSLPEYIFTDLVIPPLSEL